MPLNNYAHTSVINLQIKSTFLNKIKSMHLRGEPCTILTFMKCFFLQFGIDKYNLICFNDWIIISFYFILYAKTNNLHACTGFSSAQASVCCTLIHQYSLYHHHCHWHPERRIQPQQPRIHLLLQYRCPMMPFLLSTKEPLHLPCFLKDNNIRLLF